MRYAPLAALGVLLASSALSQDLVYKPTNPSFGGDPFYSGHLLGLADRQNRFKEESEFERQSTSERFQQQIQSALLSRVAREIADQILGENAADSGTFVIDSTEITYRRSGGTVVIDIIDGLSGGSTRIEIPLTSLS